MAVGFELVPLTPGFGVELRGFDAHAIDGEAADAFRHLFLKHHLVLIRGVDLSAEQHTALTEVLGEVSFASPVMKQGGERKYSFVSNQRHDGKIGDGELLFHSDHTFFDWPLKAISLHALAVPRQGGETLFVDAGAAYQRLPAGLKSRIAGLQGRHMASYGVYEGDKRPVYDPSARAKVKLQPLVWPHPQSGAPILFVSRLITESIIGLSHDESETLLEELFSYIEDPRHMYAHDWRVGDYLVWDNRQLQHARRDFDPSEQRTLRRVPIAEAAAITHAKIGDSA
jgi:alpha-ketoglutarate-dependent taurine dioxygenase